MAGEWDVYLVIATFVAAGAAWFGGWYYPKRQHKLGALLEVFRMLTTEPAPAHCRIIYDDYSLRLNGIRYDSNKETLQAARLSTSRIFDHIGALVKEGLIPKDALLNVYWDVIILSWKALEDFVHEEGDLRGVKSHMEDFHHLYNLAVEHQKRYHPGEQPKPYSFR